MAIWDEDWFNVGAGVLTGGAWTAGRAGYDALFNEGKNNNSTLQRGGQMAGDAANWAGDAAKWAGDTFGLNAQQVPGYEFNQGATQMPGYEDWRQQMAAGAAGAANRTGPQDQWRQQQLQLGQDLWKQSRGEGPSVAQEQLKRGTEDSLSSAMALGASQRGAGGAGALRGIQNQQAGISQRMAGDSAILRLQEQMQARGMLGGLLSGARGQDLQNQGMNDSQVQFYLSRGMDLDSAQRKANMDFEEMKQRDFNQRRDLQYKSEGEARTNRMGLLNTLGSIGAKAAGF
jgi:hypothetical protein